MSNPDLTVVRTPAAAAALALTVAACPRIKSLHVDLRTYQGKTRWFVEIHYGAIPGVYREHASVHRWPVRAGFNPESPAAVRGLVKRFRNAMLDVYAHAWTADCGHCETCGLTRTDAGPASPPVWQFPGEAPFKSFHGASCRGARAVAA